MFMGAHDNQIDGKNRVIIPAKFRDELGTRCVLTRGLDSCLILYTQKAWEEQQEKLRKLPSMDREARAFLRYIYGNAVECDVDRQGRMLIPQRWVDMAGIKKELVTIGMIDRIEIWAKEIYDSDDSGAKLTPEAFSSIGRTYQV